VFDASGNLFGTTWLGGAQGSGTVFEMTLHNGTWTETVLHSFGAAGDGSIPYGGLILDAAGNAYGTTQTGGPNACIGLGCGIVFELSPANGAWNEYIIYSFQGGSDGFYPNPPLVMDKNGSLYGTTIYGGGLGQCPAGIDTVTCGTVYKLSHSTGGTWKETILYRFTGGTDGSEPSSQLTFDSSGSLYGETAQVNSDNGSVFRLKQKTTGGWALKTLHRFNGTDGANPEGGVLLGPGNTLYGTTIYGGSDSVGVVFKLGP
jgi:uncharacterized repeat protein (TIGR03803 family)